MKNKLDSLLLELHQARRQRHREEATLRESRSRLRSSEEARGLLQSVAEAVQRESHQQVSQIVTRCIQAVFDEAYTFEIHFSQKRGKTEASLLFIKDGQYPMDPASSNGGGLLDVASLGLRLACLVLSRPKRRMFLALDEPAKMLDKTRLPAFRELLVELSQEMGIQILLISHHDVLKIGKVYSL